MKTVTLGEVVNIVMGQAPPSKACNFNGDGTPFVKVGEFGTIRPVIREWTTQPLKIAKKSDVLLCVVGATCGKINLGEDCAIGRSVAAIRPEPEVLGQQFLYYFLSTLVQKLRNGSQGAAQTVISKEMIQDVKIPLLSLPEQQRIVGILDEAFAGLATATANVEKNLRNGRELFESYLSIVVGEGGERWPVRRLEEVVEDSCSLSYGIVQPGDEQSDGLPIVRPVDMTTKVIRLGGLKRIDASLADAYSRTRLRGGELLLCVRGTTGSVSVAADELAGGNVTRGVVPIVLNPSLLTQQFGYYALQSGPVQKQIREKTYGAALMQINIRDLRNLLIPIPPLTEQESISTRLDSLSQDALRLQEIYKSKLNGLQILKQSLLQKAFSGELTSPPSQAIKEAAE